MMIRRLLCAFTWHSWRPVAMIELWLVRDTRTFCGCERVRGTP